MYSTSSSNTCLDDPSNFIKLYMPATHDPTQTNSILLPDNNICEAVTLRDDIYGQDFARALFNRLQLKTVWVLKNASLLVLSHRSARFGWIFDPFTRGSHVQSIYNGHAMGVVLGPVISRDCTDWEVRFRRDWAMINSWTRQVVNAVVIWVMAWAEIYCICHGLLMCLRMCAVFLLCYVWGVAWEELRVLSSGSGVAASSG